MIYSIHWELGSENKTKQNLYTKLGVRIWIKIISHLQNKDYRCNNLFQWHMQSYRAKIWWWFWTSKMILVNGFLTLEIHILTNLEESTCARFIQVRVLTCFFDGTPNHWIQKNPNPWLASLVYLVFTENWHSFWQWW